MASPLPLPNVYYFNRIRNNQADVDLIKDTFKALGCEVLVINNRNLSELQNIASNLESADFGAFNYVVIIISDNSNKDAGVWITDDNKKFCINTDLLIPMFHNKTLNGKLRLSVIQMNRTILKQVNKQPVLPEKKDTYALIDVNYFATAPCLKLKKWKNGVPSPFISHLCEEFRKNACASRTLGETLDEVSGKVSQWENPSKESDSRGDKFIFGRATKDHIPIPMKTE